MRRSVTRAHHSRHVLTAVTRQRTQNNSPANKESKFHDTWQPKTLPRAKPGSSGLEAGALLEASIHEASGVDADAAQARDRAQNCEPFRARRPSLQPSKEWDIVRSWLPLQRLPRSHLPKKAGTTPAIAKGKLSSQGLPAESFDKELMHTAVNISHTLDSLKAR